jgi:hypothetical protein
VTREGYDMSAIEKVIKQHEGEVFFTKTRKNFTYVIIGNGVRPIRNDKEINRIISKNDFEKALEHSPLSGPSIFSDEVQGSSYVYGILTDKRIVE